MRILHVDCGSEMRGGQRQALLLAAGLAARGVQVKLLARRDSTIYAAARAQGIEVEALSWSAVWRESRRFDIVHCHDARAHTLAWIAARAPVVVSRRVAFPIRRTWLSARKYAAARLFLSVSEAVSRELEAAGVSRERIELVPDGVEIPAALSTRTGPVVGLDSDDPGKCRAMLERTNAGVVFVPDLERAFQHARAFLYATESEGLGSAALLAMAHGVPVIASAVGGLREIVIDGRTGLLVERNDAGLFRRALDRLEDDAELAQRLAINARTIVEQGYSVAQLVERTLACYRKVLE
jgi:glycosyltransferase involved in cell wall biosynthesis